MPVKIRLARFGKKNSPFYRIVVMSAKTKREGKFIDIIGYYNPLSEPSKINFSKDKLLSWIKRGAQMSDGLRKLLKKKVNLN